MSRLAIVILFSILPFANAFPSVVRHSLTIESNQANISGQQDVAFAITVNGNIPGPTLEFTEGDEAEINVLNKTNEEVSIHWHGLLVPNAMDGVSNLTTPPILPGTNYLFKFPIRQSGTYWYHSHTDLQEQRGVFGAIVIHPKKETIKVDQDLVVMLNDWIDENPNDVLKNLKKDGDYYQYKKHTVRSIFGALQEKQLPNYLSSLWTRMNGMDLSDIGYDAFLINGKRTQQLRVAHPGQVLRLRLINAASSSYFYVNLGSQYFTVISADGTLIQPVQTKELLLGMAESYDIIFQIPEHKNYELKATAQDLSGSASAWIGMGEEEAAISRSPLNLYEMQHRAHGDHHLHSSSASPAEVSTNHESTLSNLPTEHSHHHPQPAATEPTPNRVDKLEYQDLKSKMSTELTLAQSKYELNIELDGDMSRYTWFINNKTISEDMYIDINKGDIIRFKISNKTMMHHPMHLHGHFFRVLNGQGSLSPLKHTVDVAPYDTQNIEFVADEPGLWLLHCHNLYHMHNGMAKVVRYLEYSAPHPSSNSSTHDMHTSDPWYNFGALNAFSNSGQLYLRTSNTRNQVDARIESRYDDNWNPEGDILARRWVDKYWNLFLGSETYNFESRGIVGSTYILPLLVESTLSVDSRGKLRLGLAYHLQWTAQLFSDCELVGRDSRGTEWSTNLMYGFNWTWSVGAKFTNNSTGVGFAMKF